MPSDTSPDRRAGELGIDPLLTAAETAKALRVSLRSMRRWIADGNLPVVRLGRKVLIRRSDLRGTIRSGI
ncbi:MAG TPA: helix-turn-helix domain-containing protein [Geminicoccus sp.]|nr:helix-turn-helix domain-containing protein [Geminicoccus sp.]